eukprot:2023914-Prymnesium_polylepis.1
MRAPHPTRSHRGTHDEHLARPKSRLPSPRPRPWVYGLKSQVLVYWGRTIVINIREREGGRDALARSNVHTTTP